MRNGRVVAELEGSTLTADRIARESLGGGAGGHRPDRTGGTEVEATS